MISKLIKENEIGLNEIEERIDSGVESLVLTPPELRILKTFQEKKIKDLKSIQSDLNKWIEENKNCGRTSFEITEDTIVVNVEDLLRYINGENDG